MMCKISGEHYWLFYLKLYLPNHQCHQLRFLLFYESAVSWSWQFLSFPARGLFLNRGNSIYICSWFSVLFFGFDTFHAEGKTGMVCRTFAILKLPSYLILDNEMLDLTRKVMFQRGVKHVSLKLDLPNNQNLQLHLFFCYLNHLFFDKGDASPFQLANYL